MARAEETKDETILRLLTDKVGADNAAKLKALSDAKDEDAVFAALGLTQLAAQMRTSGS